MENLGKNPNKWFWGVITLLILIVGFQSYLLLQRPDSSDSRTGVIQFKDKDLFGPDSSIHDWDPFEDFQRMQERMDRFFESGFPGFDSTFPNLKSFSFGGPISQNMDLEDKGDKYVVTLELPGLDYTNVEVNAEGQSLRISGNMERRDENKKDHAFLQTHQSQHFERYFTLPGPVKPETLEVNYQDDQLQITVKKHVS